MSLLEVSGLGISFGGLKAVDGFSLSMEAGDLAGLIGPNGAGKTTVFNLLSGIYRPDKGSVLLDGKPIGGKSATEVGQAGLARTFQNIRIFPTLSAMENTLLGMHRHVRSSWAQAWLRTPAYSREKARLQQEAQRLLEVVGLAANAGVCAGNLPYGDQRRLEIARALATRPRIILLDEPAAGLNTSEKIDLMRLISSLRQEFQVALLVIEHDMKLVMEICQRITVLDHGEVIAVGTPQQVQANPAVRKAYLGSDEPL